MDITVVDSPCGYGKSSWAIQYMNDNEDISFIYITPFLDEVKRIKEECTRRIFKEPIQNGNGKMENLLTLLSEGTNIATTHALFKNMDERCIQYLKNNEYVLIMDEVVDVVQEVDIKKDDIDMLIRDGKIKVLDDNRIIWIEENYDGSFNKYKLHLKNGDCYLFQNSIIMWTFPTKILKLFKHIKDNQIFYKTYFKLNRDKHFIIKEYDTNLSKIMYDDEYLDYHMEFSWQD